MLNGNSAVVFAVWTTRSSNCEGKSDKLTSAMSKSGVVDPSLLVKGVSGLRIVDASVFVSVCHALCGYEC